MRLDGPGTVLLGAVAAVAAAIALAVSWDRAGRWAPTATAAACVLAVTATAPLQLNRMVEAYPSVGASTRPEPAVAAAARSPTRPTAAR